MQNYAAALKPMVNKAHIKPWLVCLSAGLFFFYDFIQLTAFNTLNPYISEAFQLSATQLGYLSSVYLFATVCMLPFSGALLDRFSTRYIILNAMAACVGSTLLFAIAPNVWVAGLARFMCGASTAYCFLSCIMLATRWFKPASLALVTGVIVTMAMIGGMVSQAPMAQLINAYGWKNALLLDAGFGILLLLVMYMTIEDQPKDYIAPEQTAEPFTKSYKKALANPQNLICGSYTALMNLFIFIFGAVWGINYLQHVYQLDLATASKISSMLFLGTIIGSPLSGRISDHLQKRRLPMIVGAGLSLALSLLLVSYHLSTAQLTILFFALGLTTSTQIIIYPTIFESNPPSITGTCEAVAGVVIMSSGTFFQPLFGYLVDKHAMGISVNSVPMYSAADYQFAYWVLPVTLVISLFLAIKVKETNCKPIWQSDTTT